jgi:catechol 2,3-dioxygenase-like lactoylglutathione lyase family enzyme
VGLVVEKPAVAGAFFQEALGLRTSEDNFGLIAEGALKFFLDPGAQSRVIFELLVDNLDEAEAELPRRGFTLLTWRGPAESNFVRDPWGLIWNIYEADPDEPHLTEPDDGYVIPTIGASIPDPTGAADFYGRLFRVEPGRLVDNSHIVDAGEIRLRFRRGEFQPLLWLAQDVPDAYLEEHGFLPTKADDWVDPFGFHWARPVQVGSTKAAVEMSSEPTPPPS